MLYIKNIFLSFATLLVIGCASDYEDDFYFSQQLINGSISFSEEALELGTQNAVKKAYQMTDIVFTPLSPIKYNSGFFEEGKTYKGVIYSSVKELETYVGNDISIHTYMTAIHNPKSKIYTEDISKPPYHGTNCKTYYGAVCSSFVSYALGIVPRYESDDFLHSNVMKEVDRTNPDSIRIADVLWRDGHVAMITNILKDEYGKVDKLEIGECIGKGCKRYIKNRKEFIEMMNSSFKKVFRYTELYKNISYISCPEFVAVKGESSIDFKYNDDLCVDKGDKSCYLEDEVVIVNVLRPYGFIEIFRDSELYNTIDTQVEDVKLVNLPYGDYKARIYYNGQYSDYTYWKVVNVNVAVDHPNSRIYISSANAVPQYVKFCDIHGNDGMLTASYRHVLTQKEKEQGYVTVLLQEISYSRPYIYAVFMTDYGKIINKPVNWFE